MSMKDRHAVKSYPVRMGEDLRALLEVEAKKSGRSLHSEIIARLESSFKVNESSIDAGQTNRVLKTLKALTDLLDRDPETASNIRGKIAHNFIPENPEGYDDELAEIKKRAIESEQRQKAQASKSESTPNDKGQE